MTREEAIYVLKEISTTLKSWSGFAEYPQAIDMAIEALQAEPVKHEEWVPCSERLPNKGKLYIVTLKTFSDDYRFIDLLYYGKPLMPNCKVKGACWYRSDSEWGDVVYDDTDILAWMPLLKPYREESEVEE